MYLTAQELVLLLVAVAVLVTVIYVIRQHWRDQKMDYLSASMSHVQLWAAYAAKIDNHSRLIDVSFIRKDGENCPPLKAASFKLDFVVNAIDGSHVAFMYLPIEEWKQLKRQDVIDRVRLFLSGTRETVKENCRAVMMQRAPTYGDLLGGGFVKPIAQNAND